MVARGFSSETFVHNSVAEYAGSGRLLHVYYLGDFDRAGIDAAGSLKEKLERFGREFGVTVMFEHIAVTREHIREMNLPTREPKRTTAADKNWPHSFACELDAMPPDTLRLIVEKAINRHLPKAQLRILQAAEESERDFLEEWADRIEQGDE